MLREPVAGELISSEIEIISGVGCDLHDALARQRERRRRLFALADAHGAALGATGTHPWADYREQPIIDTEHYRRVEEGLKYVAWRNNTFSLHVHVGVRDIDRAVRGVRPAAAGAAAAAGGIGQLAVHRRPRQRASLGPHPGVHEELPALRDPRRVRRLGGLPRVHRVPRADQLDRRVHAGLVVGAPALRLRHGRAADLRRPGHGPGVRRAGLADGGMHRPGGARRGRGGAARAPAPGWSRRTCGGRSATASTGA